MNTVLITGSNGFLGSHLTATLIEKGFEVHCLIRKTSNLQWIEHLPVTFHYGDVTTPDSLPDAVKGMDYIIHTAAAVKAPSKERFFTINVQGTHNLLEACAEHVPDLKRFVFISSQAAGGPSIDAVPVKEDDPPRPVSLYGWSKMEAEKVVRPYFDRLPVTIIRPPAIYGPHDTEFTPVFQLLKKHLRLNIGSKKIISICHVADVVKGILLALENEDAISQVFNLAPQEPVDWNDIQEIAAKVLNVKTITITIPKPLALMIGAVVSACCKITNTASMAELSKMRELLQPYWIADTEKARKILGFEPEIDIETGITQTIEWLQAEEML